MGPVAHRHLSVSPLNDGAALQQTIFNLHSLIKPSTDQPRVHDKNQLSRDLQGAIDVSQGRDLGSDDDDGTEGHADLCVLQAGLWLVLDLLLGRVTSSLHSPDRAS